MAAEPEQKTDRAALRPRTMYLLNQVNQSIRTVLETRLRDHRVTGNQYTVLAIVRARDGISSADLARRFFVTPQTMNEIVTGLEKRGLIERRELPENRRILLTYLRPEGARLLEACDVIADELEAGAFDEMPEEDFIALRRILRDHLHRLLDLPLPPR
ncbi:MarR family winged helix-turn-helix transcriptional regulator [Oceanicella sp. SM1341]|uniref:MarR family winged helix-turn-helix transcriptional regulator n=1 Tax=Oceanicella sp. SM1341 TaxID=1548889 RepID=UPI001E3B80F7|nr:MarR family transcriptional regulator [Oceanicella sp. SM1341]